MIQQDQKENYRSKGVRHKSGKIFKGCIQDATTKKFIGSIPTTYQSIIYRKTSQTGFGVGQSRFEKSTISASTNYLTDRQSSSIEDSCMKIKDPNQLGLGAFISKVQRLKKKYAGTPGPGNYILSSFIKKKKPARVPIWNMIKNNPPKNKQEDQSPGPGQYNLTKENTFSNKMGGCKSSFITNVDRSNYIPKIVSPGPSHYHKSIDIVEKKEIASLKELKIKYKKEIKERQDNIDLTLKKMLKKDVALADIPGPTTYNQQLPEFKSFYEKVKVSRSFAPTLKDRFGNYEEQNDIVIEANYSPTPFTYNSKSSFDEKKQLIGSPVFMSQSKRIPEDKEKFRQGPNLDPFEKQVKKQFHFNIKEKWL